MGTLFSSPDNDAPMSKTMKKRYKQLGVDPSKKMSSHTTNTLKNIDQRLASLRKEYNILEITADSLFENSTSPGDTEEANHMKRKAAALRFTIDFLSDLSIQLRDVQERMETSRLATSATESLIESLTALKERLDANIDFQTPDSQQTKADWQTSQIMGIMQGKIAEMRRDVHAQAMMNAQNNIQNVIPSRDEVNAMLYEDFFTKISKKEEEEEEEEDEKTTLSLKEPSHSTSAEGQSPPATTSHT